jgi:bifunctional DNA-binding transcriptional regulator/antitoxin component of YhaV-PrlF toxin-antitoxin module
MKRSSSPVAARSPCRPTLRKRLGIKSGDVMILEDRGDEVVLKPGVVVELQLYADEQVARWDAEDTLSDEERTRILARLPTSKTT